MCFTDMSTSLSFSQLKSVTDEFCSILFTGKLNLLSDQHCIVDKGFQTVSHLISLKLLGFFALLTHCVRCFCAGVL